jgi:predicted acyl esterase
MRIRTRHSAIVFLSLLIPAVASFAEIVGGGSCTAWPGGRWEPDAETYGMQLVAGVPVVMDDGVTLFADIGYPTDPSTGQRAAGKFPVLLAQNPYISAITPPPDIYFISRGYIYINATVRGTLNSEAPNNGSLVNGLFSERQAKDGVELVQWAAALDGSNGVVGLTGCSQLGIDQVFTAAALPPSSPVKAILPACAANDYEIYFAGGIPSQTIPLFASPLAGTLSGTQHAAANLAAGQAIVTDVLAGGDQAYNREYWRERDTSRVAANIVRNHIPALFWSGWNATESNEALKLYPLVQNAWLGRPGLVAMSPLQPTTGRYQIIVGPGAHGEGLDEGIMLEWYDTWLKGQGTQLDQARSPMHLYELQGNRWVNARGYPIVDRYTPYYLEAGGGLSIDLPAGSGADTLAWGQPTVAGSSLTYATPPFANGATLAGPISASIYASSSNTNMELLATLYDVAADGSSTQITTGTLLGSMRTLMKPDFQPTNEFEQILGEILGLSTSWYDDTGHLVLPRHPFTADQYLMPSKVERMDVELFSMLWSVLPGHSLQLVLTTQAPNALCSSTISALAKPSPCVLTAPQLATLPGGVYQVQRARLAASVLNLPLLGFEALPTVASAMTPTSPTQTQPLDWGTPGYCGQ